MSFLKHSPYLVSESAAQIEQAIIGLEQRIVLLRAQGQLRPETLKAYYGETRFLQVAESNAIEGSTLSEGDTKLVILQAEQQSKTGETLLAVAKGVTLTGHEPSYVRDALALGDALRRLEELAKEPTPLTLDEVKDLHGLILAGREGAGMFRSQPVRISGSDHRPPATWREVMDAMETWEHWSLSQPAAPALLRAAVLHAWLVHIHPFLDGNGRTARAVANLELIRKGYPPIIIRKKDRRQYLDALHRSDEADLAPLLELFEARLQDALRDLERTAATKQGYSPAIARIRQRQQQTVQIWNAALTLLAQRIRECLDEALVNVGGSVSKWNLDPEPLELEEYIQLCNMKSISRSWWLQVELRIPGVHRVERLGWIGFRSNELMAAVPELAREPSIFWSVPSGGYPVWRRAVPSECPFVQEFSLQGDRWVCLAPDGRVTQLLPGELARKVAEGLMGVGVG